MKLSIEAQKINALSTEIDQLIIKFVLVDG
jgi:hypothetical protein